jgi:hypothetical protein
LGGIVEVNDVRRAEQEQRSAMWNLRVNSAYALRPREIAIDLAGCRNSGRILTSGQLISFQVNRLLRRKLWRLKNVLQISVCGFISVFSFYLRL